MKYNVRKNDYDPACVQFKTNLTDQEVFKYIALIVQEYLDDNIEDNDVNENKITQELLDAMKSNDWKILLKPANDYLNEFNGEYFEVTEA